MIIRTPKELLEEYESHTGVSQSELKSTLGGIHGYKRFLENKKNISDKYYDEPAEHFIIGTGVDHLITYGAESFNNTYYISDIEEKPSDAIMSIVKAVFDTAVVEMQESQMEQLLTLDMYRDMIILSANTHQWNKSWGDDAKYNNIVKAGSNYFNDLVKGKGRKILSLDQYNSIISVSNSFVNGATKEYLTDDDEYAKIYLFFQVPVYFSYSGLPAKGLVDLIRVEVTDREASVRGFDLKTMSGMTSDFLSSYRRRRYDVQASWYRKGILNEWQAFLLRLLGLNAIEKSDYDLITKKRIKFEDDFFFLVESTNNTGVPMVYRMGTNELVKAERGRKKLMYDALDEQLREIHVMYIPEVKGYSDMHKMVSFYRKQGDNITIPYVESTFFNITWENTDIFLPENSGTRLMSNVTVDIEDSDPF